MGPRTWKLEEANAVLPRLRPLLVEAREALEPLQQTQQAIRATLAANRDIRHPAHARHHEWQALMEEHRSRHAVFDDRLRAFAEAGVLVKDVASGLVDFYGEIGGRLVFLCWREDEDQVTHWHELEGGFAARKAIPELPLVTA